MNFVSPHFPGQRPTSGSFLPLKTLFLAAPFALALCAQAHAEGPSGAGRSSCASFGHDFVAVSGASGCVRIGGHVRAETAQERSPSTGYANAMGDGVHRASESFHVRAGANSDTSLYRR
jgi:hypothetical protein